MAQKNRYLFRGRISERKFRDLLRLFALDITADKAAVLTGLHHNTVLALYRLLRLRMAARSTTSSRGTSTRQTEMHVPYSRRLQFNLPVNQKTLYLRL